MTPIGVFEKIVAALLFCKFFKRFQHTVYQVNKIVLLLATSWITILKATSALPTYKANFFVQRKLPISKDQMMALYPWANKYRLYCTIPLTVKDDTCTWPPHLSRSRKVQSVTLRAVRRPQCSHESGAWDWIFAFENCASQNHGMAGWSMMNHSSIITAPGLTQRTSNMLFLGCVTIKLAATISFNFSRGFTQPETSIVGGDTGIQTLLRERKASTNQP